jgi:hypothetical protein
VITDDAVERAEKLGSTMGTLQTVLRNGPAAEHYHHFAHYFAELDNFE